MVIPLQVQKVDFFDIFVVLDPFTGRPNWTNTLKLYIQFWKVPKGRLLDSFLESSWVNLNFEGK